MSEREKYLDTEGLFKLIRQEKEVISDKFGFTPLIELAKRNAELDALSPTKKKAEESAAGIVEYLDKFDETDFSNLELYINASDFSKNIVRDKFFKFLVSQNPSLNLRIKANLVRFIQGLSNNLISSEIIKSIEELKTYDPWLYAEILIDNNWVHGVKYISTLLPVNYDGGYLFSLLPDWKSKKTKEEIEFALTEWFPHLSEKDKNLASLYCKNYGFVLKEKEEKNEDVGHILEDMPQFNKWLSSEHTTLFKTLQSNA